jgi:hypothetical protein
LPLRIALSLTVIGLAIYPLTASLRLSGFHVVRLRQVRSRCSSGTLADVHPTQFEYDLVHQGDVTNFYKFDGVKFNGADHTGKCWSMRSMQRKQPYGRSVDGRVATPTFRKAPHIAVRAFGNAWVSKGGRGSCRYG